MSSNLNFSGCSLPKLCLGVTSVSVEVSFDTHDEEDPGWLSDSRLSGDFCELGSGLEVDLEVKLTFKASSIHVHLISFHYSLKWRTEHSPSGLSFQVAIRVRFFLDGGASLVLGKSPMLPVLPPPPATRAHSASGSPRGAFLSPGRPTIHCGGGIISPASPTPDVLNEDAFFMPGGRCRGLLFPRRNNLFPRLT